MRAGWRSRDRGGDMSERSGGAAQAASGLSEHQFNMVTGVVFIALAALGPILALSFGKGSGILDAVRGGWFSLPLAIFGLVALFVRIRGSQDFYGGAVLAAIALFALWASNEIGRAHV